jgi:uncharacterized protein
MGVEVKPLGVKCNIHCQYCYQNPIRDAGNLPIGYDLAKIKSALEAEGRPFSLFGGEPLLMRRADLEDLWAWGFARFGRNAIQTNGTLIDADFIRLFKQYRVRVGISIDGPSRLNDVRWAGSLEATRRSTAKTENAIEWLCREAMPPSLIVTLTRINATGDALPVLHDWMRHLEEIGVRRVRLHVLESETDRIRSQYGLTARENVDALLGLCGLRLRKLKFDLFTDMRNMLRGRDHKTACIWMACDPYTTQAVSGIEGDGQRSNCSRTNKDGIDYVKSNRPGFERYLALYLTPQEAGGCKDCRFFLMCKGQCPGTAIAGDWRNRTEHCEVWKEIFTMLEGELLASGKVSLSRDPRREDVERSFIAAWSRGENESMSRVLGIER